MDRTILRMALALAMFWGCMLLRLGEMPGELTGSGIVFAADSLKLEGLSNDPKQFRTQVDQAFAKVAGLIETLKSNPNAQPLVLDLMQTRDNILREIRKIEVAPGDAKWTAQEMRDSVKAMLMLLKDQYEKAAGMAG